MRKISFCVSFLFLAVVVVSCAQDDGIWDDNIQLSRKNITVDASLNTIEISAKSTNWWLNEISFNGNLEDLSSIDKFSKNFVYATSEFEVERKEDGKKIVVKMNQNTTNVDRTLQIGLQNGNYFDGITITQLK